MTATPRTLVHEAIWVLLLAVGVWSTLKGAVDAMQVWGRFNWMIGYEHGFIRRGLMGAAFQAAFGWMEPEPRERAAIWLYHATVGLLLAGAILAMRFAAMRSRRPALVMTAAAVVCTSQAWPHLGYDVGYLDPFVLLVAGLAAWAVIARRPTIAAALTAAGPLIHEEFLFLWAPLGVAQLILLVWVERAGWVEVVRQGALLLLPALAASVAVAALHDPDAARAVLADVPMTEAEKQALLENQLGSTVGSAFGGMMRLWRDYPANGIFSVAFFAGPALLLCWLGARALAGAGRGVAAASALAVGSLGCLAILALAWDLSRFATLPLVVFPAVLAMAARVESPSEEGVWTPLDGALVGIGAVVALLGAMSPFVFTYFDGFFVIRGWFQQGTPPLEDVVRRLFEAVFGEPVS